VCLLLTPWVCEKNSIVTDKKDAIELTIKDLVMFVI